MPKMPIACHVSALNSEQQKRRAILAKKLYSAVERVDELENGYVFQYSLKTSQWMEIAEFVDLERRCCPFFSFQLDLEPENATVRLYLTGEKGTKEFLQTHDDFAV